MNHFKPWLLLLLFLVLCNFNSFAQLLSQQIPETDGIVYSIDKSGDTLYLGGTFTRVYDKDSSGKNAAQFSLGTGIILPVNPFVDGAVNCSVSDGTDGFIFGGDFRHCGDSLRNNLARVDTNGNIKTFASGVNFNGPVNSVVRSNDTLYVGGDFTSAGANTINNTNGGVLNSSNILDKIFPSFNGAIYASVADGKGGWVVSGAFGMVGNASISQIVRIDSLGNTSAINVHVNNQINALAVYGDTLFIGGQFSTVNGISQKGLAAYKLSQNMLLSLNWQLNNDVYQLLTDNSSLLIRGSFDTIAGIRRYNLAMVNMNTAAVDSFNAAVNLDITMAGIYNHVLYISGYFSSAWGVSRTGLASYNLATGTVNSWNPVSTNPSIARMAFLANTIYVAGNFSTIGGQSRSHLAALDLTTGTVKSWNPNTTSNVYSLFSFNNSIIVCFSGTGLLNNKPAGYATALDTMAGTTFKFCPGVNGMITTMTQSGSRTFFGGYFTGIGTDLNCRLAIFRISDNTLLPLNFNIDDKINSMVISGNTLYIAGRFKNVNGISRVNLAGINCSNNTLLSWNPNTIAFLPVPEIYAIAASSTHLFVAGNFTQMGGQFRTSLAAFSIPANTIATWNPSPSTDFVKTIAVLDNKLFVSGDFSSISSALRNKLAVYDLPSLTLSGTYLPNGPYFNSYIKSFYIKHNRIFMAGDFGTSSVMTFDTLLNVDPWALKVSGNINTLNINGTCLFTGGSFWAGGMTRNNLASVVVSTGKVTNWKPEPNSTKICGVASYGQNVYVAGDFSQIAGSSIIGLAKVNKTTGIASADPSYTLNSSVAVAYKQDTSFFIAGSFTSCGNSSRQNLAAVNMKRDSVYPWTPGGFSGYSVNSLAVVNDTVYIGGFFNAFGGQLRNNIASFRFNKGSISGTITSWAPNPSATVYSISAAGPYLAIGGLFNSINGESSSGFGVLTRNGTGTLVKNYLTDLTGSAVTMLNTYGNTLYFSGGDYYLGGMGSIDLNTKQYSGWAPGPQSGANTLFFADGKIYAGTGSTTFFGTTRSGTAILGDAMNTALPVTWLNFSAKAKPDHSAALRWNVASQLNCAYYTIERSTSSYAFKTIGHLQNTSGNSTKTIGYSFDDKLSDAQNESLIFYRLKQVDLDGSFSYSKTISVHFNSINKQRLAVSVYPNPSQEGAFTIESDEAFIRYSIYDYAGNEIIRNAAFQSPLNLDIQPGLYILKLTDNSGNTITTKLFAQ